MAITIDYQTKIISVPQADLTPLGGGVYELDANAFRNTLKNLEDSEDGMPFPPTLRHSTAATLSGVTYARQLEIINGYRVACQNTGTPYVVKVTGANHNLGDVMNFDGGMSMVIGNSAGLIVSGSGVSTQDKLDIADAVLDEGIGTRQAGSLGAIIKDGWERYFDLRQTGAVLTPLSPSAFTTTLTESVNDYWKDALCCLRTGAMAKQVKRILTYDGTTKMITVKDGFTGLPEPGVLFDIVTT